MTLTHLLGHRGAVGGDRLAIVEGARAVSYIELSRRARSVAASLERRGVGRGDRVAVLLPNCTAYWEALFACAAIGATMALINEHLAPAEIAFILADCEPTVVITTERLIERLPAECHPHAMLLDAHEDEPPAGQAAPADDPIASTPLSSDEPILLTYTSGTTGRPKGVVLSHENVMATLVNEVTEWQIGPADRTLAVAPFSHIGGLLAFALPCLYTGGTIQIAGTTDPDTILDALARNPVTLLFLTPTMWRLLARATAPADLDLTSVRLCASGGDSLTASDLEQLHRMFPSAEFNEAYGLSEASSCSTVLRGPDLYRKRGSIGRPFMHNVLQIHDPTGRQADPHEIGEIVQAGPSVMRGYWRRDSETHEALRDGWLHTGDMGYRDDDGFLFVVARKNDMFNANGAKIYPTEIERVLTSHPAVAEAAVFPRQADAAVEPIVAAAIVPRPGATVNTSEIHRYCEDKIARHKIPEFVVFTESLPRNTSGKLQRHALIEQVESLGER